MARPPRIEYPGAIHHVTNRGNCKQEIYINDYMRQRFTQLLQEVVEKYDWQCHAYCLMNNHYHLLIETKDTNLSKGMQELNGRYAQLFNRIFDRSGHLFQGRFKSFLVEKDNYLLNAAIYLILNPVRARLVDHPENWPWSSYHALMGKIKDKISSSWMLGYFSDDINRARECFRSRINNVIHFEGLTPVGDKLE